MTGGQLSTDTSVCIPWVSDIYEVRYASWRAEENGGEIMVSSSSPSHSAISPPPPVTNVRT